MRKNIAQWLSNPGIVPDCNHRCIMIILLLMVVVATTIDFLSMLNAISVSDVLLVNQIMISSGADDYVLKLLVLLQTANFYANTGVVLERVVLL